MALVIRRFNDVCPTCRRQRRPELRHAQLVCRPGRGRSPIYALPQLVLRVLPATAYAGSMGTRSVISQLRIWPRLVWDGRRRPRPDGPSAWSGGNVYLHVPAGPTDEDTVHRVYCRGVAGYRAVRLVERQGRWMWVFQKMEAR